MILLALFIAVGEFQEYVASHQSSPLAQKEKAIQLALPSVPLNFRSLTSVVATAKKSPLEVANAYLEAHKSLWKIQQHHQLRPVEFRTPLGSKVKYSVFQGNIPVLEMGIEIQLDRNLNVTQVQNSYRPIAEVNLKTPALTAAEVVEKNGDRYQLEEESSILSPVLYSRLGDAAPELAYVVSVKEKGQESHSFQILFRASDGQVLSKSIARTEF